MSPDSIKRLWINPWKYYSFTADMNEAEKDALMQHILRHAELGNEDALKEFEFISFQDPYLLWRRNRPNPSED